MTVDAIAPATRSEHLVTVLFGLWMTVGLFLDGYAHQHLDGQTESFATPWHAVFYAGFGISVFWLWRLAGRRAAAQARVAFLPPGYRGAAIGVALFAAGGAGDAAWHSAFGVERGVDALLSPTHLLLFAGLVLVLTAPLRAVRAAPSSPPGPWIVVASATSAAALAGFFLNFVWGLGVASYTRVAYDAVSERGEVYVIAGIASMLVTTAVLFGAARCVIGRVRVPPGACTVMFGTVGLLVAAAFDEDAEGIVAALVAGVTLDICLRVFRTDRTITTMAASFAVASAALWLTYLLLLEGLDGIAWNAELVGGAVVLNALAALAVAVLGEAEHGLRPAVT